MQAAFTPATIERLVKASASVVTTDAESRRASKTQLCAPDGWADRGQLLGSRRAAGSTAQAATLLTAGEDGEPVPWMEVTWRFLGL